MAWSTADAIYDARADDFSDDITEAEAEYVFQQALVDSRRMMCDPEYERMIVSMG